MSMDAALPRSRGLSLGRALAAARVIHPFPTLLNVGATLALALIAHGGVPSAGVMFRLGAAMFCAQAAIGAANDYYDRDLDAQTKPWKPVARGLIDPRTALALAAGFALAGAVLAATFGPLSVAAGAAGLVAGLAYDMRLKRSLLSALPFMVALPALPIWVWVSLGEPLDELWWLLPFAPLAGLAVHLSNTAPDIETDARVGVRGLPHVLGVRRSLVLAWASFAAAIGLAFLLGLHLDYEWRPFLLGATPAAVLLVVSIVAFLLRPGGAALQLGFGLIGIATACLAGGWLAAVS